MNIYMIKKSMEEERKDNFVLVVTPNFIATNICKYIVVSLLTDEPLL